ncbi:diacylglycerol kinase family protein [Bacillus sp. Marseille-Q1617]|uniref:diacylglycerol/lipid kinase family protein n=1 Tax=Bacillus sp. Marseille-Q1617 TaxID=2736887 RepID=UPI0015892863|nr:diacylglycerol kinase family protein [Bacillus sp. Marseille-Q1617]
MKTIFIVNPSARNDHSLSSWKRFQKNISIPHMMYITDHPEDVRKIVEELVRVYPQDTLYIIGVGGDGTMNSIISGTAGFENIFIGYIPEGSGNDFARGYQWPARRHEAYNLIKETASSAHPISLDAGLFSIGGGPKQYFVNNIGVGFDALIAQQANASLLKKKLNRWSLGKLIYPILLCRETFTFTPFQMTIEVDGEKQTLDRVWFITISNQPYFGGGMKIAPEACPYDGELDLTIVSGLSKWKLLFLFISVFFGKHTELKEVHTLKGQSITIESGEGIPVHADGDFAGVIDVESGLNVKILPGSWKMLNRSRWQKC